MAGASSNAGKLSLFSADIFFIGVRSRGIIPAMEKRRGREDGAEDVKERRKKEVSLF